MTVIAAAAVLLELEKKVASRRAVKRVLPDELRVSSPASRGDAWEMARDREAPERSSDSCRFRFRV